jgi:hypothetical protein
LIKVLITLKIFYMWITLKLIFLEGYSIKSYPQFRQF